MTPDILSLLDPSDGFENDVAYFRTRLRQWTAPVYLHTVYKPIAVSVQHALARELRFSPALRAFYAQCNGVNLFGVFSIFGCLPQVYSVDRSKPLSLPPFDLREWNQYCAAESEPRNLVVIGAYSFDRSFVCMSRANETVMCLEGEDFSRERKTWKSLEAWLKDEIQRLTVLHAPDGRCLAPPEALLPSTDLPAS